MTSIERGPDRLVESTHFKLHDYLNMAFVNINAPTTNNRGRHVGSIHGAFTRISDSLKGSV